VIRSRVALERFIVEGVPLTQYPGARPSAEEYRKVLDQIQADLTPG
jgi:cellulose biosynthesis protein BcsQ